MKKLLIIALALFIVMKVASVMRERAIRLHTEMRNALTHEDEAAAEQARIEAEEKAAAEAAAKAEAERLKAEAEAEKARAIECREQEIKLLGEICELLREKR